MKVSCLQKELSRGLVIVGRAVATRTTLPITQNVLMATDRSMLKLSATNLEIAITTWIGAMVEEEGSITVPARLLTEFVGSLPAERIDLAMTPGPRSLQLTCSRSQARVNGTDAEGFPPIPMVGDGLRAKIEPGALKAAISQVVFAAATEESRPVLTGVKLDLEGDRFTMVALDGYRLAVHKGQLVEPLWQSVLWISGPIGIILPARTMNELNRLLSDQDGSVEIIMTPDGGSVLFQLEGIQVVSQLIRGTFPSHSRLIPQSYQTRTVFNLQELVRAAKMAAVFGRDGSCIIRLQMTPGPDASSPGKVEITARADEMAGNLDGLHVSLDASIEGEEAKIAFDAKHLLPMLSAIDAKEVVLETTSPSGAAVFRPVGWPDTVFVLMPLFVVW